MQSYFYGLKEKKKIAIGIFLKEFSYPTITSFKITCRNELATDAGRRLFR